MNISPEADGYDLYTEYYIHCDSQTAAEKTGDKGISPLGANEKIMLVTTSDQVERVIKR